MFVLTGFSRACLARNDGDLTPVHNVYDFFPQFPSRQRLARFHHLLLHRRLLFGFPLGQQLLAHRRCRLPVDGPSSSGSAFCVSLGIRRSMVGRQAGRNISESSRILEDLPRILLKPIHDIIYHWHPKKIFLSMQQRLSDNTESYVGRNGCFKCDNW